MYIARWPLLIACLFCLLSSGLCNAEVDDRVVIFEVKLGELTSVGDYKQAEEHVKKMLDFADRQIPRDHQNRCYIFSDSAGLYVDLENYERALELAQKALAEAKFAFAPNDSEWDQPL